MVNSERDGCFWRVTFGINVSRNKFNSSCSYLLIHVGKNAQDFSKTNVVLFVSTGTHESVEYGQPRTCDDDTLQQKQSRNTA